MMTQRTFSCGDWREKMTKNIEVEHSGPLTNKQAKKNDVIF